MFDSPFAEYVERQVTITPGGGNAKTPTQPFIASTHGRLTQAMLAFPARGEKL